MSSPISGSCNRFTSTSTIVFIVSAVTPFGFAIDVDIDVV
jgi:hypothetical protein